MNKIILKHGETKILLLEMLELESELTQRKVTKIKVNYFQ